MDDFHAAEILRKDFPADFELLTRTPLAHRRFLVDDVDDVAQAARWPLIELDERGGLKAMHINERTLAPLELPAGQVEYTYAAIRAFPDIVYDPAMSRGPG